MRVVYIAAGAAGSYCGACARDAALARRLTALGHDVQFLPLYTPVRTDGPDPSRGRVFYGGINAWLEQKSALFRRLPRAVGWLLDRPFLLRLASRFAVATRPEDLGPMTVSVLQGAEGRQRRELEELLRFLEREPRPGVVNLTNSLLSGIVPALKERLSVPVVCTLQGEESFVAALGEPHRSQAHALIRQHARLVDLFLAPSGDYADEMAGFLAVGRERIRIVHPGFEHEPYANAQPRTRAPFRIGFLSRLSADKGLDLAAEAFRRVAPRAGDAVLAVAGQALGRDRRLWGRLHATLAKDGLAERVEFHGELDLAGKVAFLQRCSVFCLPSRIVERRGMAVQEALAAGVPVVVPARGVFPEVLSLTGGGIAVPPDDPQGLADALARLHDDPDEADRLGRAAAAGVAEHYSAARMADEVLAAYRSVVGEECGSV
jgi:glycosyltransferase involved in cell wall biosynthesis